MELLGVMYDAVLTKKFKGEVRHVVEYVKKEPEEVELTPLEKIKASASKVANSKDEAKSSRSSNSSKNERDIVNLRRRQYAEKVISSSLRT